MSGVLGVRPLAALVALLTFVRFVHSFLLPKIAGRLLQRATIRFKFVRISEMSKEDDSMMMHVEAEIDNPSPLPCTIFTPTAADANGRTCLPSLMRILNWPALFHTADRLDALYGRCLYLAADDPLSGERKRVAILSLPPVSMRPGRSTVTMQVRASVIDRVGFNRFTRQMIHSLTFPLTMDGEINIKILQLLQLESVRMVQKIGMQGMQGLQQATIKRLDVEQGYRDHIQLRVVCFIDNPSNIEISMGQVEFELIFCDDDKTAPSDSAQGRLGTIVGTAHIYDMKLEGGSNEIVALVRVQPDPEDQRSVRAAQRMLSNYVSGLPSKLLLSGTQQTTPLQFISDAMSSISIPMTLDGLSRPLLVSTSLLLFQANPVTMIAPAQMLIQNPFDEYIMIYRVTDGQVGFGGRIIGTIDYRLDRPMVIPPKQTKVSEPWPLSVMINLASLNAILQVAANQLTVDVDCWLEVKVGQFETRLQYKQQLIPVRIS